MIDPTVTCTCAAVPFYLQLYSFLCHVFISIESDESEDDTLCPCGRRNEEENMIGCDGKTCAIISGTTSHVQASVKLTSPKDYGTVTVAQKPS